MTDDRAPLCAAALAALAMTLVAAFWVLFVVVGGNGYYGLAGNVWVGGNVGAAVLAWVAAPWWAARRCGTWRRRGWPAARAAVISALLALAVAVLALLAFMVAMAGVVEGLR